MFKRSDDKVGQSSPTQTNKEVRPVSTPAAKPSNNAPSIIGADVRLTGNLVTTGEIQFDGSIEGDLECGALTVGNSAQVSGNIKAETVTVHGKVSGTINAKRVKLEQSSKVIGDIVHQDISVASGAHIEGSLKRADSAPAAKPAAPNPASSKAAE